MKRLLLLPALFSFLSAYGQRPDSVSRIHSPHVVLKLVPLSLFDVDPTLQGALEIRLTKRVSWQGEFGYGWPELGLTGPYFLRNDRMAERKTWRFRTEGRYYFRDSHPFFGSNTPAMSGAYLSGEYLYKQTNVSVPGFINPTGAGLSSAVNVPVGRFVQAFHAKAGFQTPLSRNPYSAASRLLLDVYAGMGLRQIRVRQLDFVDGVRLRSDGLAFSRFFPGRTFSSVSFAGGVKIGWML